MDTPSHDPRTDEALMLAYRGGEAAAFDALYARHRTRLYRALRHQCGRREMADEVAQEVWMSVIRGRENYEVVAKFSTWLYRIMHNRLIDAYRAQGRLAEFETSPVDDDGDPPDFPASPLCQPERQVLRQELAQRLVAAVESLPAAQREAFLLAEEGGLTVDEIAQATGCGFETAKSRLRYAYARLRAALEEVRCANSD